ncbi:MAG: helix-turn-helix domain-containing protein, partial [Armatimonadetes bacterium]|nr:helix-turn-helix domain-containing protein [Armatimonadota bacterium]
MDLSTRQGRAEQGRRIQSAAELAGLSLADLAKRIGCSRALIYQYVSGQVLAQADRVQAIARACGKPLGWFYGEDEEPGAGAREEQLERLRLELDAERLAFERARGRELTEHLAELADAQAAPPDFAALRRTCERLAERARDLADPELLAEAEFRLGNACYALGDYEATRAAMSRAVSGFRELGRTDREGAARQTLGGALAGLGERDRALAEFEAARAAGGFSREWRARVGRADVFEALGRGEEALAELAAAEELLAACADPAESAWAELFLAGATVNVYLLNDDFQAAA